MKNLLVFEDDVDAAELVNNIFIKKGYNVSLRYHVDNYIQDIVETQPHVILLDLRIPSVGGEIICRNIKMSYKIPVVLYSADYNLPEIAKRAGADDFITKPFHIKELYASVEVLYQKLNNESSQHPEPESFKPGKV